jgi:hypothetical protein
MAAHALGALGGTKVKSALEKALESEQDEKVKAALTAALQ